MAVCWPHTQSTTYILQQRTIYNYSQNLQHKKNNNGITAIKSHKHQENFSAEILTGNSFQKALVVVISTSSHLKSIRGNPPYTHDQDSLLRISENILLKSIYLTSVHIEETKAVCISSSTLL